jgi:hypothetical protein
MPAYVNKNIFDDKYRYRNKIDALFFEIYLLALVLVCQTSDITTKKMIENKLKYYTQTMFTRYDVKRPQTNTFSINSFEISNERK